ncbi:glycosyltransferase [Tessaracoccus sp. ZS01]|uniref:glycosyltransferase n=1 Tax=Tessaracoccus sp. ZS01 TaxID=1906324 RepID=UPI00096EB2AD|nr:glycosyltransferase [Tessaracoccus sp. ZS01]OMG54145.1 hypothetical protein BJN44_10625 [Tessaracoccus sp. ZS01]
MPTLLTGGAENFVLAIATRFDPNVFEIVVIVTRGQATAENVARLRRAGLEVVMLGRRSWITSLLATALLCLRRRPDVIHTNIGSLLHVSLGSALLPRPVTRIHTLHNIAGFAERGLRMRMVRGVLRHQGFQLVSISNAVTRSAVSEFHLDSERVCLIPNGVDTNWFAPSPDRDSVQRQGTRFVAVGSLLPVKAHGNLVRAFAGMLPSLREDCFLTIVGGGPLYAELQDLIETLGLKAHVNLLGQCKDVRSILLTSDIFVSGSRSEGFPLSLLEAMATGLPSIVTAVGGVVDAVRDEEEGLLVAPQNVAALTNAMERLVQDAPLRKALSRNARQRALKFSWDKCVNAYSKLYRAG